MAATLTTDPTHPVPGDEITLTVTGLVGSFQRYELTTVPNESALAIGFLVDAAGADVATFAPDVAGAYGFDVLSYDHFPGWSRYPGDPLGEARDVLRDSDSVTLYVGQTLDMPIATTFGAATLRMTVENATVRAASMVDTTTEAARVAALDSTVVTKLAALVGTDVTDLDDDLATTVNELATAYTAHIADGGLGVVHASADTTNALAREAAYSNEDAITKLGDIYDKLIAHMQAGTSGGTWHGADDTKNTPITVKAKTLAGAYVNAVDLRFRVYTRHLGQTVSPDSHITADATNTITAASVLPDAIVAFLDALATTAPSAPTGEQQGAIDAAHLFGFARSA